MVSFSSPHHETSPSKAQNPRRATDWKKRMKEVKRGRPCDSACRRLFGIQATALFTRVRPPVDNGTNGMESDQTKGISTKREEHRTGVTASFCEKGRETERRGEAVSCRCQAPCLDEKSGVRKGEISVASSQ